jgi:hypothetical protein
LYGAEEGIVERLRGLRWLLLLVDGLALVGVIAFSVLAAVDRHERGYVVGQIVSVVVVLGSALLLRWLNEHPLE